MPDDQISVDIVAKVDELRAGLTDAVSAMREAVASMQGDLHKVAESSEETEGALQKLLSIETFRFLREQAEMAFDAIKEGFEATIGAAEEFGLNNAKFAAMMGVSEEQAAGLAAALRGVGSSSEEYETIALRLTQKVNANEAAMNAYGVKTRDAGGHLLSTKELMDSAIQTMESYKSGADQNAFATEVFGRRAQDVYNMMRVGDEQVSHQIDLYKQFGVTLTGTGETSQKVEEALNDLHTMVQALGLALGQQLMPAAIATLGWMGHEGKGLVEALSVTFKVLETTIVGLKAIVETVVVSIAALFMELIDHVKLAATLIKDVMTGNFGAVVDDYKRGSQEMADDLAAAGRTIASEWAPLADIWKEAKPPTGTDEANPFKPKSGGKEFHPVSGGGKGGGGPDKELESQIHADEKLGEARIANEASTNAHLLEMGMETVDAFVAQARELENERYAVQLGALKNELALAGQTQQQRQRINNELAQLEVTHVGALAKIDQDGESRKAAIAQSELATYLKTEDEKLKAAMSTLDEMSAAGKLSVDDRDQAEILLTQTIRHEELQRLSGQLATLESGSKEYKRVKDEMVRVERQFTEETKAENAKRRKDTEASVGEMLAPFTSGFNSALNGMIFQAKSFSDAMREMWTSVAQGFLSMLEQMAEKWAVTMLTNAVLGETTAKASAASQIAAQAAISSAEAFAASASAGLPGLIAAPGVASAAYSTVIGMEGLLASAAGGMVLDRDQLVFAHKEEMVLPAHLSQGLASMIAGGGGGGGGGDTTLHYAPTVNAPQNRSLEQMLRDESGAMMAWLAQKARDGAFSRKI